MSRETYKEILRTRGKDKAQAYRINRNGIGRKAEDELRASKAHLRDAMELIDGISQDILPDSLTEQPVVIPEPHSAKIADLAPNLRQLVTS